MEGREALEQMAGTDWPSLPTQSISDQPVNQPSPNPNLLNCETFCTSKVLQANNIPGYLCSLAQCDGLRFVWIHIPDIPVWNRCIADRWENYQNIMHLVFSYPLYIVQHRDDLYIRNLSKSLWYNKCYIPFLEIYAPLDLGIGIEFIFIWLIMVACIQELEQIFNLYCSVEIVSLESCEIFLNLITVKLWVAH